MQGDCNIILGGGSNNHEALVEKCSPYEPALPVLASGIDISK